MLQLGDFSFLEIDESLLILSDLVCGLCHMLRLLKLALDVEELLLVVIFLFGEQFDLVLQLF